MVKDAIPKDIALKLCEEIREENARKKLGAEVDVSFLLQLQWKLSRVALFICK
jgi:hypothetical protein